jgi:hypothetical protein
MEMSGIFQFSGTRLFFLKSRNRSMDGARALKNIRRFDFDEENAEKREKYLTQRIDSSGMSLEVYFGTVHSFNLHLNELFH